jgi:hypothetical protein
MKLAHFGGDDGKIVYINPELVRSIVEVSESRCFVYFSDGHAISIPLPASLVAADLKKASN